MSSDWPDINRKPPRLRSDISVIVGIIVAIVFAFLFAHGDFDSLILGRYWQGYYGEIADPDSPTTKFDIEIDMRSSTFGALTPIDVDVRLQPRNETNFVGQNYQVFFDGSIACLPVADEYRYRNPCYLELERGHDTVPNRYHKVQQISYSYGGDFTIHLGHPGIAIENRTTIAEPIVHISSDATTSLYTFRFGAMLGIVGSTLGFLNWYQKYRECRLAKLGRD